MGKPGKFNGQGSLLVHWKFQLKFPGALKHFNMLMFACIPKGTYNTHARQTYFICCHHCESECVAHRWRNMSKQVEHAVGFTSLAFLGKGMEPNKFGLDFVDKLQILERSCEQRNSEDRILMIRLMKASTPSLWSQYQLHVEAAPTCVGGVGPGGRTGEVEKENPSSYQSNDEKEVDANQMVKAIMKIQANSTCSQCGKPGNRQAGCSSLQPPAC